MAGAEATGPGKRERREQRRLQARRRKQRTRLRRAAIFAALLALPALWLLDRSGPQELVKAEVIETRLWRHSVANGKSHPHTAVTLRIEGLVEARVSRGDDYERGERVPVWIRRGRISSRPYFLDVAKPGEIAREADEAARRLP